MNLIFSTLRVKEYVFPSCIAIGIFSKYLDAVLSIHVTNVQIVCSVYVNILLKETFNRRSYNGARFTNC